MRVNIAERVAQVDVAECCKRRAISRPAVHTQMVLPW